MSNYIKKSDLNLVYVEIRRQIGSDPVVWSIHQAIFHNTEEAREWVKSFNIKELTYTYSSIKGGQHIYIEEVLNPPEYGYFSPRG